MGILTGILAILLFTATSLACDFPDLRGGEALAVEVGHRSPLNYQETLVCEQTGWSVVQPSAEDIQILDRGRECKIAEELYKLNAKLDLGSVVLECARGGWTYKRNAGFIAAQDSTCAYPFEQGQTTPADAETRLLLSEKLVLQCKGGIWQPSGPWSEEEVARNSQEVDCEMGESTYRFDETVRFAPLTLRCTSLGWIVDQERVGKEVLRAAMTGARSVRQTSMATETSSAGPQDVQKSGAAR